MNQLGQLSYRSKKVLEKLEKVQNNDIDDHDDEPINMTSDEEETPLHRKKSKVVMYSELNLSPYNAPEKNEEHSNEDL